MTITTVSNDIDAKGWLKAAGYEDVLGLILKLETKWKRQGKGTRRDWFLVLAGTPSGQCRRVSGVLLPMIQAFRRRQGYPIVSEALERSAAEVAPPIRKQVGRWGRRWRRATH